MSQQPQGTGSAEQSAARHRATSADYPFGWARRFELWLDHGHRRTFFYGGILSAFVIGVVTVTLVLVLIEY